MKRSAVKFVTIEFIRYLNIGIIDREDSIIYNKTLTINEHSLIISLRKDVFNMRKKDEKKIELIKNAVIKLILEYGFHGTSISKIAKEAGVSPATIYIYYENKDIMINEIYHQLKMNRYNFMLGNINLDMSARDTLKTICESYYHYSINHEEEFFFIKQFASCPCFYKKSLAQQYSLDELLNRFKESNEIKEVNNEILVLLLISPIEGIVEYFFRSGIRLPEEEIDQMFDMVWEAIAV